MRAASAQTEHKPVKFYYIWLPEVDPPREGLRILGIGILVAWGVSYFGLVSLFDWVFERLGRGTPHGWWFVTILAAWIGPIGWIVLMKWLERGERPRRRRAARLSVFEACGAVAGPSPYRLVELALRGGSGRRKRFVSGFKQVPAGSVIIVNWSSQRLLPNRAASEVPFEPIDLLDDRERLGWLPQMDPKGMPRDASPSAARRNYKRDSVTFRQRPYFHLNRWVGIAYAVFLIVWWFVFSSTRLSSGQFLLRALIACGGWLVIVAVIRLLAWVAALFYEHRWWLVPGGLVCRGFSFWRRGVVVKMFTPADTPLFLDARDGTGGVLDGGRLLRFGFPEDDLPAVIAAWVSRARTPSIEEVRAFVGQEEPAALRS